MFVLSSFCFCQQILEEQDFKEEDFGLFQLAGQRCIDEGHIEQLLEIIQNEKNKVSTIFEYFLVFTREITAMWYYYLSNHLFFKHLGIKFLQ